MPALCGALIKAQIADPESQDGIDFCVNLCPYPDCTASAPRQRYVTAKENAAEARQLHKNGFPVKGIAVVLEKSERTIQRYLEGK